MLNVTLPAESAADTEARKAVSVERAKALASLIESVSDRVETERRIPEEVLRVMHEARLFRLLLPRSCGGEEVDPATFFEVTEAIAAADASVAWCVGQGCGVSMYAAYLKPEVARTVFGAADAVAASGPSQKDARADVIDGGYRVSGSWTFASGSRHSQWLGGHCTVYERDGRPRPGPDGKPPEQLTVLFPKSTATMTDVWHVMGLKGTGSDNYSVKDIFVPDDFTFTRESAADRREAGPLYRFSVFNMFGVAFAGIALGIARKMLDDFIRLAKEKKPTSSATLLRDNAVIQSQVGLSEARLQSSRLYVHETFRRLHAHAASGVAFTNEQRINNRIVTCHAIHQAREVVHFVYHAAGGTAVFEAQPFERRFRDFHALTQQGQAHFANFEALGQVMLGVATTRRT